MVILLIQMLISSGYSDTFSFTEYKDQFKSLVNDKGHYEGTIELKGIDRPYVGWCYPGDPWRIEIDYFMWINEDIPEFYKRETLFHELTHCILDMGHSDDPNNYMFWRPDPMTKEQLEEQVIKNGS